MSSAAIRTSSSRRQHWASGLARRSFRVGNAVYDHLLSDGSHSVPSWLNGNVLLAEVGTVQMEFGSLAYHANRRDLRDKSDVVFDLLDRKGPRLDSTGGRLWPIHIRPETGMPSGDQVSWGAMGDSYYEYLLKYWLLTGKKHDQYKRMYLEAVKGMISKLLVTEGDITYVAESKHGNLDRKMDHLVCFVPGTLALGAQHIPEVHDEHMRIAKALVHTCYQMYAQQPTGLAPEFVRFPGGGKIATDRKAVHNLLRPEAIEAIFLYVALHKGPKSTGNGLEDVCRVRALLQGAEWRPRRNPRRAHRAADTGRQDGDVLARGTLKYFFAAFRTIHCLI